MSQLFQKSQDYICVTLNEEDVRIAYLKLDSSGCELVSVVKRDIRGISEEELPKVIKSALNDFKIKKPNAICVVPTSLATTKNIEIPSLDPAEIKSIINLQAGRHTPYSREEIIIDYVNIGTFQRNYSKILLIIVNRTVITKQLIVLERAGLKIQKVLFAPEAMARFYSKAMNLQLAELPIGIIDIGRRFTDFTIGLRGTIIACRNIPVGTEHLTAEGQGAKEKLVAELKKSIESYQSEDIEKLPESYLLTADNNLIKELQLILKDALKSNVKIAPYLDNIRAGQISRKLIADAGEESFLDIIAPIAALKNVQIDLLPEEVKIQHSIEEQGKEAIKSGAFIVILIVLVGVWFFSKIYFKSSFLNALKANHEVTRQEAQILEHISEKTAIIKDHLNNRLVSLDAINELYRIIPEEIYLNSISLDENGTITIQGTSESMSRVFSLVGALEESDVFKSVKTNSTTAKRERGKDVAAFELTFKLESAKDETEEKGPKAAKETAHVKAEPPKEE